MTEQLMELADRCEAAKGPDRELDSLVHCALKGCHSGGEFFGTTAGGERYTVGIPERSAFDMAATHHKMRTDSLAPAYSSSLDAAMTLVPEGWDWSVGTGRGTGWATLGLPDDDYMGGSSDDEVSCDAVTPALALCAAALRARAQSENLGGGDE